MKHLYPLFLNIAGKKCLVIGGGKVALRKIQALLAYDADITVVSPYVEDKINNWLQKGMINLFRREFKISDLDGMFMVFIATDDNSLNQTISSLCREQGILVNAVDDPENCDFYVPAVLRRQSLAIAISTEGKSPAFAGWLKRELENTISEQYGEFVELLGELRPRLKRSALSDHEKRDLIIDMIRSDWMEQLESGQKDQLKERMIKCISSWQG